MAVKRIIGGTFEFIKDTGKQAGKIVPDILGGMIEQAVQGGQQTPAQKQQANQQMQQKAAQVKKSDEEELKKARMALVGLKAMQSQFAPKKPNGPTIYEQNIQDLERKKAQQVEAQKNKPFVIPVSKQSRGMMGMKKAKGSEGLTKDTKVG